MNTIYSTCATCAQTMLVTEPDQRAHPDCAHSPDPLEQTIADYVTAATAGDNDLADQLEHAIHLYEAALPRLGAAALAYAQWGWPVFPLRDHGKAPLPSCRDCRTNRCDGPQSCGHQLCHGLKGATTDPELIRVWWAEHPQANIGLVTGRRFDVLDIDLPTGIWSWVELRDSGHLPPIHGIVTTPSGQHVYLPITGGGNLAGVKPGIDYRGEGGYVVAPPSIKADGARYMWAVRPSPTITTPAGEGLKAA